MTCSASGGKDRLAEKGKTMTWRRSAGGRRWFLLAVGLAVVHLGCAPPADARIRNITLNPPTFPFGNAPYEVIEGIAIGEIDPQDPLNSIIQDVSQAPLDS